MLVLRNIVLLNYIIINVRLGAFADSIKVISRIGVLAMVVSTTFSCHKNGHSGNLGAPDDYMEYRNYTFFKNGKMLVAHKTVGMFLSIFDSRL